MHLRPLELTWLEAGQWAEALLPYTSLLLFLRLVVPPWEGLLHLHPHALKAKCQHSPPDPRAPLGFKLELRRTSGVVSEILSICRLHWFHMASVYECEKRFFSVGGGARRGEKHIFCRERLSRKWQIGPGWGVIKGLLLPLRPPLLLLQLSGISVMSRLLTLLSLNILISASSSLFLSLFLCIDPPTFPCFALLPPPPRSHFFESPKPAAQPRRGSWTVPIDEFLVPHIYKMVPFFLSFISSSCETLFKEKGWHEVSWMWWCSTCT